MSNRHCRIVLAAFASVLSLCNPSFADAGLFRAYLSVHGADTNSCALADPCRLLPAALAAVAPPRIGAVLNVGTAHLGEFGSQEVIAQTKGELVESLPSAADACMRERGYRRS